MRTLLLSITAAAALMAVAPTASQAQFAVEVPGVGVRVGEPRPYYRERDEYRRPMYREREVRSNSGCRTITIQRDDGSMKRIRRCD